LVNGGQSAATGLTTVNSGGALGGTGIIGGDVDVQGGSVNPGDTTGEPGTLNIYGGLVVDSATTLNFNFNGTDATDGAGHDWLTVSNGLTLDGTINIIT